MKHLWPCLILLFATAAPAWADSSEAPYYGPMKRWHGIGTKFGYEDRVEKDGAWRIDVSVHRHGEPVDMAMYRAAARARDEGYRFVFFLGVRESSVPGSRSATLYARPSHEPVSPEGCRFKKATTCYTADVAEVLRMLGGPGGAQPGVAIADHRDKFGREVFLGYGVGMVSSPGQGGVAQARVRGDGGVINATKAVPWASSPASPVPASNVMPSGRAVAAPPRPARRMAVGSQPPPARSAAEKYDELLKASQPLRGRESTLGWKISD